MVEDGGGDSRRSLIEPFGEYVIKMSGRSERWEEERAAGEAVDDDITVGKSDYYSYIYSNY